MNYQPTDQPHLSGGLLIGLIVFYVVLIAFFAWVYVRIVRKAGYSGWWVLMALVPIGNLIVLCLFAFKEWPVQRELHYLRGYAAHTGLPGYAGPPPGQGPPSGYGPPASPSY